MQVYRHNKKNNKGFSLIELLVVIGIIAVLAGLTTFNFNSARMRARDVQRKNDLRTVQKALELYKSDNNQKLPTLDPVNWDTLMSKLVPNTGTKYLDKKLSDPKYSSDSTWTYTYTGSTLTYTLTACLENTADNEATTTLCPNVTNGSGRLYKLTNE